ncbi:MAG: hypothetical protein WCB57_07650 [Pseudonocardiaceae bacterium]
MHDSWTEQPYAPGAVLIGDAAGWNDPIIGQGLSIALRDVRMATDVLMLGGPRLAPLVGPDSVAAVSFSQSAVDRILALACRSTVVSTGIRADPDRMTVGVFGMARCIAGVTLTVPDSSGLLTIRTCVPIAAFPAADPGAVARPPLGGGRQMAGAGVASVLQRVPVAFASTLGERLDVPGGRLPFPVVAPLAPLLPGGLRPGSVVAVQGSTALLLALLVAATARGSWAAVIGVGDLGVLAAAEAGVVVQRLALIPRPGPDPAQVAAALLDGVGLVALAGGDRIPAGVRRSLAARARQRGSVLLPLGRWPGADIELDCRAEAWYGAEDGHGRLRSREVVVRLVGRGAASRPRTARLLLPGPGGPVAEALADLTIRAVG